MKWNVCFGPRVDKGEETPRCGMAAAGQRRVSSRYRHPEESSHQPSDFILLCAWRGEPNRLVWFVLRHPRGEKQRRCATASRQQGREAGGWRGGVGVEVFPCRINRAARPTSCNTQPRGGRQRPLLGARRDSRAAKGGSCAAGRLVMCGREAGIPSQPGVSVFYRSKMTTGFIRPVF